MTFIYLGGTDICSLFAGMCTALPVYRGEIQCRMLGMAVESFDSLGNSSKPGEAGELVCVRPFPCMPVGFWPLDGFGNEDSVRLARSRYQQAYFSHFKDVWCGCFLSSYAPTDKSLNRGQIMGTTS
jgi:acetoacetyl-CoA synthetase